MAGAALEATGTFLSIMSTAAQFAPVPYTGAVISLAESILTMVQRVRSNKVGFQQLATDIHGLVGVIRKSRVQSSDMKKDLGELFSLLTDIKDFVEKHSSHNLFHRMYTLRLFMFKAQINIHENIDQRVRLEQWNLEIDRLVAACTRHQHAVKALKTCGYPSNEPSVLSTAFSSSSALSHALPNHPPAFLDGTSKPSQPSFSYFSDSDCSSDYGNYHLTRPASPEGLASDGDLTISTGIPLRGETECKSPNDTAGVHSTAPVSEPTLDADRTATAQDAAQSPQSSPIMDTIAKPEANSVLPLRKPERESLLRCCSHHTPTPLPDDLGKAIAKNRSLRPILGVAMAFHGSPSVLQIARVLDLKWEAEVSAALKPISSYFEHLDSPIKFNSDVRPRQILRDSLLKRAGTVWLDAGKYHNFVARWCLVRQTLDAKDIIYANDFWDFHVRNANPSPELYEALKSSWIPLDPVSHEKLPGVIHWLEENGGAQASDLLAMYHDQSRKPREEIQIMGGLLKFSF
ncbi:hypothetical protein DFH06DRAFT_1488640 [Mycena polygramma]|nr:hypothetical protein DFH06DRAFT_1488640 [Mycena polygramma]